MRRRYKLMSKGTTNGRKAVLIRSLRSRPMTRARENKRKIAEKRERNAAKQKSREPEPSLTPKGPVTFRDDGVLLKNFLIQFNFIGAFYYPLAFS